MSVLGRPPAFFRPMMLAGLVIVIIIRVGSRLKASEALSSVRRSLVSSRLVRVDSEHLPSSIFLLRPLPRSVRSQKRNRASALLHVFPHTAYRPLPPPPKQPSSQHHRYRHFSLEDWLLTLTLTLRLLLPPTVDQRQRSSTQPSRRDRSHTHHTAILASQRPATHQRSSSATVTHAYLHQHRRAAAGQ